MTDLAAHEDVREALVELQRYLSDELAPMMVAASVELLFDHPPEVVLPEIRNWVGAQYSRGGSSAPVSDYLFHTVKKVHDFAELNLIERERVERYVAGLSGAVLTICPEEDRQRLRENLDNLGTSRSESAKVEYLHRQAGDDHGEPKRGNETSAGDLPPEVARSLQRFTLLVERMSGRASSAEDPPPERLQTQLLASAAAGARDDAELQRHLEQLRELGVDASSDRVMAQLARGLPDWVLPAGPDGAARPPTPRAEEAMQRIVSMASDVEDVSRRFTELLHAAVEQFNEGAHARAVRMLDLAERALEEKKISPEIVKSVRSRAHESLSESELRRCADEIDKRSLLARLLRFFPGLSVRGLLDDLDGEPSRERRKLMLALLEAHGAPARAAALELLETYAGGGAVDPEAYFQRNLVYLLRRIPRQDEQGLERELDLLERVVQPDNPLILIKEAIGALGSVRDDPAVGVLATTLQNIEGRLERGEPGLHEQEELVDLLDRIVAALAHHPSAKAVREVVRHALKTTPPGSEALERLERLGGRDLSCDGESVERLVEALRRELPKKLLGFVVQRRAETVQSLVRALAGTRTPEVNSLFEEIVRRFPGQPFAAVAAEALSTPDAPSAAPRESRSTLAAPGKVMSGDLALFGLPNLMQSLSDSRVTGLLTLNGAAGQVVGRVRMVDGRILECEAGHLSGESAVYELFERPAPGTFVFHGGEPGETDGAEPLEVLPVMLEALRRHDEFEAAAALVPDESVLQRTDRKPTRPADEQDMDLLNAVWSQMVSGSSARECEAMVAVDAYRVRRLLAHWVEQGSLRPLA